MSQSTPPPDKGPDKESVPLKALANEKAGALNPHDSVSAAGERMRKQDSTAWPVAEDRKLVGMIDEKNPDWILGGHGHDPNDWKVGNIMSREVIFCYEDEDCRSAEKLMKDRGLNYLPVVDRQMRIVGIFSREEVEQRVSETA